MVPATIAGCSLTPSMIASRSLKHWRGEQAGPVARPLDEWLRLVSLVPATQSVGAAISGRRGAASEGKTAWSARHIRHRLAGHTLS